ncbi:Hypothetical protein POVN_LOCUS392 [uncultured virus]|nr:Hypothetical protein POVN_LOCUS392 [uncultured virus]
MGSCITTPVITPTPLQQLTQWNAEISDTLIGLRLVRGIVDIVQAYVVAESGESNFAVYMWLLDQGHQMQHYMGLINELLQAPEIEGNLARLTTLFIVAGPLRLRRWIPYARLSFAKTDAAQTLRMVYLHDLQGHDHTRYDEKPLPRLTDIVRACIHTTSTICPICGGLVVRNVDFESDPPAVQSIIHYVKCGTCDFYYIFR